MIYQLKNLIHRLRGWKQELYALNSIGLVSELRVNHSRYGDLGVVSRRLVTNAGVGFLVDAFQNLVETEVINFHDSGTGTNAENVSDTVLQTPAGPARVSGTQSEPATNQYRTVATIPYTGTLAITEHGIFTASSGGTLWDRSVFSAINVVNGDSIQFTYTLTVNAGG